MLLETLCLKQYRCSSEWAAGWQWACEKENSWKISSTSSIHVYTICPEWALHLWRAQSMRSLHLITPLQVLRDWCGVTVTGQSTRVCSFTTLWLWTAEATATRMLPSRRHFTSLAVPTAAVPAVPAAWSVGRSVSLSVCHTSEPCKNGCTDWDAVWVESLWGQGRTDWPTLSVSSSTEDCDALTHTWPVRKKSLRYKLLRVPRHNRLQ